MEIISLLHSALLPPMLFRPGVKMSFVKIFSRSLCVQIKLALARETINMHNNNVPLLLLLYTTQLLFMLPYSKMLIVYNHHVVCDAMCVCASGRKGK